MLILRLSFLSVLLAYQHFPSHICDKPGQSAKLISLKVREQSVSFVEEYLMPRYQYIFT